MVSGPAPATSSPASSGGKANWSCNRNSVARLTGTGSRRISYRPDLLATLQRHELDRVGEYLAAKGNEGSIYVPVRDGTLIRGTYRRSIMLASGKFAVIQRDEHFTLVPWRAILERFRGREVVGVVRGTGVSWQVGLQRDRGFSR